jgi:hypothetical protein
MKITQIDIKATTNTDLEFTVCIPNWIEMPYFDGSLKQVSHHKIKNSGTQHYMQDRFTYK